MPDHTCGLNKIWNYGFDGDIISTSLSSDYTAINLRDECKIHNKEIEKYNSKKKNSKFKYLPLTTERLTEMSIERIKGYLYNEEIVINENVSITFLPNGHIGGSSFVFIKLTDGNQVRRLLFSGDQSGYKSIPFTKKCNFDKGLKVNYLFTESTNGDKHTIKNDIIKSFYNEIKDTCISKRKSILIPCFSMGRSLTVLYYLKQIFDKHEEFKEISVVAGSPMLVKSVRTGLATRNKSFYDDEWNTDDLASWGKVEYIEQYDKLMDKLTEDKPTIYAFSAGMLGEGGFSSGIAEKFINKKHYKMLIVGYQTVGCLGRDLLDGVAKSFTVIDQDGNKKKLTVRCDVSEIKGLSSHASQDEMIEVYNNFDKKKIHKIIVTHGETDVKEIFGEELKKNFEYSEVIIPKYNQEIRLC